MKYLEGKNIDSVTSPTSFTTRFRQVFIMIIPIPDRTPLQEPILVEALGLGQQQQRLQLFREGGFGQGQIFQKER